VVSAPENKAIDIIDLQLMPDWVKQSGDAPDYSSFEGEEESSSGRRRVASRAANSVRPRGSGRSSKSKHCLKLPFVFYLISRR